MKSEKWQKINELFHAAIEIEADKRDTFIRAESGDEEIFAEVRKLISAHEESKSFIQTPVAGDAFEALSNENSEALIADSQSFSVNQKIGRFEIVEKIGKGGMGEVFLARDTTLGRDVAIKILLPEFTTDEFRLNRFQLEAKTASALNHPNILTIYEIGETEDFRFIATEFVKGKTLNQFLQSEKVSLSKLLKIATQIVSALQTAHEAGIAHRDIKPDNVMVRNDGIVKILDFGLAKLLEDKISASPSRPVPVSQTTPGLIMGTPNYMSPEQARGKDIDFQTDIFSFGIVLYEMLSGKLPFSGDTTSDIISSILTKEPKSLGELNPEIPPELEKIVQKCLQKDKQNRYQTAKSVFDDLTELTENLQAQDRLEKSFVPNKDEAKTQILQITTLDEKGKTVVTQNLESRPKPLKKYLVAGLMAILISVLGYFGYQNFFQSKQIDSIAVIPFINKTNNADMEYLSDGMTETLINSLSKIPKLNVKARSSVFRYKGNEKDFKKIADELKVQAILTGEVIQRGEQLILNLELIDTETENRIWGESYTRKQSEVVTLQTEIARDVSNNLKLKLSGAETAKIEDGGTTNPEAYQFYLKGKYWLNAGYVEKTPENIQFFQRAVELDPNFALGYVGLADAYTLLGTIIRARMSSAEAMPKAKAAAEKAIKLNPNLSEAYTSRAWIKYRFDWDWTGAEKDFQKAIELNPKNSQAHHWFSELLYALRRYDESVTQAKIGLDLEPYNNLIQWTYGKQLFFAKRYDESLLELLKAKEQDKNDFRTYAVISRIYIIKGMDAKALKILVEEAEINDYSKERIKTLQEVFQQKGIEEVLKQRSRFALEDAQKNNANEYILATNNIRIGNHERALDLLEKAYEKQIGGMTNIYGNTLVFESIENEPRYKELLRKMKFIQ